MQQAAYIGELPQAVNEHGFAVIPNVLSDSEIDSLIPVLGEAAKQNGIERRGEIHAMRNLLETVPEIAELARSATLRALVEPVLGSGCFAVRGILFDKTPGANWKVTWHQDRTIAVKDPRPVPGYGPWSEKAGIHSVQPPASVLEAMVTIRINLDECGPDNGPVRVLPGSHRHGRLGADEITMWRARVSDVATVGPRGAALVMRPLLLHASSPAVAPQHRRGGAH